MSLLNKPVALSLMRASGSLHLGNYLGALKNWIAMVNDYEWLPSKKLYNEYNKLWKHYKK